MNLPNKLTVVRLIVIPFFLILMVIPLPLGCRHLLGGHHPGEPIDCGDPVYRRDDHR